jgi:hypothetical protein
MRLPKAQPRNAQVPRTDTESTAGERRRKGRPPKVQGVERRCVEAESLRQKDSGA